VSLCSLRKATAPFLIGFAMVAASVCAAPKNAAAYNRFQESRDGYVIECLGVVRDMVRRLDSAAAIERENGDSNISEEETQEKLDSIQSNMDVTCRQNPFIGIKRAEAVIRDLEKIRVLNAKRRAVAAPSSP